MRQNHFFSWKEILAGGMHALFAILVAANTAFAQEAGLTQPISTLRKLLDWVIEMTVKYSFQVLGGIIVLIAGWICAKFVSNFVHDFLKKHHVDVTVAKFITGTAKLAVMAFAVLIALGKFGIEIAPFIAGLSVIGFGTSFALQGPLSNYAAGVTLIFTKPFKVGDIIEVLGVTGEVQDMTLPRTILKTVDDTMVVIPNKHIIGEIIHNYAEIKRVDIKVGVAYKGNIDKSISILRDIVSKDGRIVQNPEPKIGISDFGDSSVNLYARVWGKQSEYWDILFDANRQILEQFGKAKIEIPFPQRDVHLLEAKRA